MLRILGMVLSCAALSGCISVGGADAIKPIASDVSASSYVDQIVVANAPPTVSAGFPAIFTAKAGEKLKACARGSRPLRLEANITDFHARNPAMTWLVGDSNRIRGSARLIDPATNAVVADYDINRSTGGGGLIAVMAMSDAEGAMSSAFGEELCKRAFASR